MALKNRIEKLEKKQSPELITVTLKWHSDRSIPLPEPHISGSCIVRYDYADWDESNVIT